MSKKSKLNIETEKKVSKLKQSLNNNINDKNTIMDNECEETFFKKQRSDSDNGNEYGVVKYNVGDELYPERLVKIKNRPDTIYVKGNLPDPSIPTVGIVGARCASDYGYTLAKNIARTLSRNGVQVISGMALGIDSAGHIGSIEAERPTFAVLGNGVNICYPAYNYNIYEKIIQMGGGIIAEVPNDTPPLPANFPRRNRIIAGLSDVLIVIEAKKNSGSLITVEYMLSQGKDVFSVPGRVGDILSEGTNDLIKQGAYIFTNVNDVFEYLGVAYDRKIPICSFDKEQLDYFELKVYDTLNNESMHIDEIVEKTKLPVEKVLTTLMSLQIDGIVEQPSMGYYRKNTN